MAYSMAPPYATVVASENRLTVMRIILLLAAIGLVAPVQPADARGNQRSRDQEAAYRAAQRGTILPLAAIRMRFRVPGAQFIGAEFDPRALVYRLKYMRGSEVIWIDVDARTGRPIGRPRN